MVRIGSVIALVGIVITVLSIVLAPQRGAVDPAHEAWGWWAFTSAGIAVLVVGVVLIGFGLVTPRRRLPS